ncbi:MAG TPA: hypothetical protein VHD32_05685 [Candidatus Didemnitutus sp.]|nr:hypothetical protein [Candidatus Didemnitutus sp.]
MRRVIFPCIAALLVAAPACVDAASLRATLTDAKSKPVEDAVVSATPLDRAKVAAAPLNGVAVEQKNQSFIPYVTAVTVGTSVLFPNDDTVQHHIYSLSKPKRFEKPLYSPGAREAVVFDQPGVVTLGCNIHDWMIAYIVVLETPYFAKSGDDGSATLSNLPAGRYRVEVWHPLLGKVATREVTLADGAAASEAFSLALKADRRIHRAPEGKSSGY